MRMCSVSLLYSTCAGAGYPLAAGEATSGSPQWRAHPVLKAKLDLLLRCVARSHFAELAASLRSKEAQPQHERRPQRTLRLRATRAHHGACGDAAMTSRPPLLERKLGAV